MATKRMLIDAVHPEETRVVVVDGNRLEELEFESADRKQLKGNIYLAKVTRVEPSLQAAFVEYGGNRHGFLAFSEIHPDYYQIPVSDREALEAEVAQENQSAEAQSDDDGDDDTSADETSSEDSEDKIEESGGDDTDQVEQSRPRYRNQRRYKIQEVIKKRQIILVQVVKEERGNKGAALTTYLSLAGRYCVLMPNTDKGGGISRKISNAQDRKRLKSVLSELSIPKGTAVIVRTAGSERSKAEIRRDFDYLMRLWSNIRDVTLQSQAPALIYEEANLIKRSIRDMYSRDIDEVQVEGEEGYRIAKDFMKMLIPSHAKKVQPYRDEAKIPLFHRFQVESQLDAMHSPVVQLPSGGYIVINPTEALVSIDVNSGRSTKERNIEETALKTNLEAADEIARSLRLRDLAGLVVVDFIDMEINRNQMNVERRIKEATKNDRARIQIGRISPFGLLEMSRQRLRPSFTETSTEVCAHCQGTGLRRSLPSSVLEIMRVIEEEGIRRRSDEIIVHVPNEVALYIFNNKRTQIAEIEERYQMTVMLSGDDSLVTPIYKLERIKAKPAVDQNTIRPLGPEDSTHMDNIKDEVLDTNTEEDEDDDGRRRRRRRRPRRRKPDQAEEQTGEQAADVVENEEETSEDDDDKPRKRRRRGKRGGRRRTRRPEDNQDGTDQQDDLDDQETEEASENQTSEDDNSDEDQPKPRRRRGPRRPRAAAEDTPSEEVSESTPANPTEEDASTDVAEEKPKRRRSPRKPKADSEETSEETSDEKPKPRRRGRPKKSETPAEETAQEKPEPQAPKVETELVVATTAVTVTNSDGQTVELDEDKKNRRKGWWSR